MHPYTLTHVSNVALLADLAALVAADRQNTAALLAHIAEVEARELFLPEACSSMHVYCTRVLGLAEDVAFKRIRAARIARRFPQIFAGIADGRFHLSGILLLGAHPRDENADEVLAAAASRSKAEIELLVARLAPQPDLPTAITPVVSAGEQVWCGQQDPDPVASQPPRVKAIAPERFALQVTISQETRDKLEKARALMRHRNPSGDLAEVLDQSLDALIAKLEREKFGATSRPRARRARAGSADPGYVTNDVRRAVYARDGGQCTFVSASGVRCTERGFIELDHRDLKCRDPRSTSDEIRLLCKAHNQYEAERLLGADFMRTKREAAKASRAVDAPPFDVDVSLALQGMGFKPTETRRAMVDTAELPAATFEERIRVALAALTRSRASEGPFERLN